jgi:hypothetical protein
MFFISGGGAVKDCNVWRKKASASGSLSGRIMML